MGIRREGSASAPLIRLRCLIGEEETRVGHGVTRPEPLSRYIAEAAGSGRGGTKGTRAQTFATATPGAGPREGAAEGASGCSVANCAERKTQAPRGDGRA